MGKKGWLVACVNPAGITCQAATFPTIASAVVATNDFSTLLAGVQAAGLVPALSDPMFAATVFAPTNAVGIPCKHRHFTEMLSTTIVPYL